MANSSLPFGGKLSANSKNIKNFQVIQKIRAASMLFIIGIPLVIGVIAFVTYRRYTNPANDGLDLASQAQIPLTEGGFNQDITVPAASNTPKPSGQSSPSQNQAISNGQSNPSQISGMPEGVSVALNSIETNGIKYNPYVAIDTSGLPDGTVVKVDRSSWFQASTDQGTVNGTLTAFGQARQGSLTFALVDGTWKVISYSVNN